MTKKYNGDHATYSVVTYICTVYVVIFAAVLFFLQISRVSPRKNFHFNIYGYL